MEPVSMFLSIMLSVLGIVLLVVLIILGIKLIRTVDTMNRVMDDIEGKVKSLNSFFHMIDTLTDNMALISDRVIDGVSSIINRIFRRNKKKEDSYYE